MSSGAELTRAYKLFRMVQFIEYVSFLLSLLFPFASNKIIGFFVCSNIMMFIILKNSFNLVT